MKWIRSESQTRNDAPPTLQGINVTESSDMKFEHEELNNGDTSSSSSSSSSSDDEEPARNQENVDKKNNNTLSFPPDNWLTPNTTNRPPLSPNEHFYHFELSTVAEADDETETSKYSDTRVENCSSPTSTNQIILSNHRFDDTIGGEPLLDNENYSNKLSFRHREGSSEYRDERLLSIDEKHISNDDDVGEEQVESNPVTPPNDDSCASDKKSARFSFFGSRRSQPKLQFSSSEIIMKDRSEFMEIIWNMKQSLGIGVTPVRSEAKELRVIEYLDGSPAKAFFIEKGMDPDSLIGAKLVGVDGNNYFNKEDLYSALTSPTRPKRIMFRLPTSATPSDEESPEEFPASSDVVNDEAMYSAVRELLGYPVTALNDDEESRKATHNKSLIADETKKKAKKSSPSQSSNKWKIGLPSWTKLRSNAPKKDCGAMYPSVQKVLGYPVTSAGMLPPAPVVEVTRPTVVPMATPVVVMSTPVTKERSWYSDHRTQPVRREKSPQKKKKDSPPIRTLKGKWKIGTSCRVKKGNLSTKKDNGQIESGAMYVSVQRKIGYPCSHAMYPSVNKILGYMTSKPSTTNNCIMKPRHIRTKSDGYIKSSSSPPPPTSSSTTKGSSSKKSHTRARSDGCINTKSLRAGTPPLSTSSTDDDEALMHAKKAGVLWQTLVGQHVKFPSHWFNGARAPQMGVYDIKRYSRGHDIITNTPQHKWKYVAIDYFFNNTLLDEFVPHRKSPGRLLLHLIIVRDRQNSHKPIQDIALGCYHPNARHMTKKSKVPEMKDCRVLWMATRRRSGFSSKSVANNGNDAMTKLDRFLNRENHTSEFSSPVGGHKIKNKCLEEVFGNEPPIDTLFISESELIKKLENERAKINSNIPFTEITWTFLELFLRTCIL